MLCGGSAGDETGAFGSTFRFSALWLARRRGDRYRAAILPGDLHNLCFAGRIVPGFVFQNSET